MMTALERELLAQDPGKTAEITAALERAASYKATKADHELFAMFKVVSIGICPSLLVATKIGGGR